MNELETFLFVSTANIEECQDRCNEIAREGTHVLAGMGHGYVMFMVKPEPDPKQQQLMDQIAAIGASLGQENEDDDNPLVLPGM